MKSSFRLASLSSPKTLLALFILLLACYALMGFWTLPRLDSLAGLPLPETLMTGYAPEEIQAYFSALGEQGREVYLYHELVLDLFFPALYGLFFCGLFIRLLKQTRRFHGFYRFLCLIPLLAALLDYGENLCLIKLLTVYPLFPKTLIQASSVFTVLKSLFFILSLFMVFLSGILFLIQKIKKQP